MVSFRDERRPPDDGYPKLTFLNMRIFSMQPSTQDTAKGFTTVIAALPARVKNKISRLYDGPLLSSLTAVASMALSIICNIRLS